VSGRIPSVEEVRGFVAEKAPDKREQVVERLLEGPTYVKHFANVWRAALLGSRQFDRAAGVEFFEAWLRWFIGENFGYDQLARAIVVAGPYKSGMNPFAFYVVNDCKPETVAGSAARAFLGMRLECAQCHDHPYARWKREQFWEFAACFAGVQPQSDADIIAAGIIRAVRGDLHRRELTIPGTDRVVRAHFPDGREPADGPVRVALGEWMTARENPAFARALANRLWWHFFGIGLVEPVDDLSDENQPSHPALLDHLAREAALHDFDVKHLIRGITFSRAYRRTSKWTNGARPDPRAFAAASVKGLSPEQLVDSLMLATGCADTTALALRSWDGGELSALFSQSGKPTEFQASILQALALMNGACVDEATRQAVGRLLSLGPVGQGPDPGEMVETLFLTTVSRMPSAEERRRLAAYVASGGANHDRKAAAEDVLWALLNSGEFMLNH
jgi:hypothetical protein